jgi:hypothetical protein
LDRDTLTSLVGLLAATTETGAMEVGWAVLFAAAKSGEGVRPPGERAA